MANYHVTTTGRKDVGKHSDLVREVAFELWWLECSRDAQQVAKKLASDPIWREQAGLGEGDVGPSDDSIRRWAASEAWAEEAHRRMRQMAPHMLERGAVALVYGSAEAVNTVLRLSKGAASGEKFTVSERVALDAAKEVLDRVYGQEVAALARPTVDHAVDFDSLESIEDIMQAERQLSS